MNYITERKQEGFGFITWMQIIGCILVIVGHSYPLQSYIPEWALAVRSFIYTFHMPVFVWCSGYLIVAAAQTEKYTFFQYIRRRFVHILLPYFAFSFIALVPKILLSSVLNDVLSFDFMQIIRAFLVPRESVWGHFWFLPMIFILGIVGYFVVKLLQKRGGGMVLFVLIAFFCMSCYFAPTITGWFGANDVIHYSCYLFLGIVSAKFKLNLSNKIRCTVGLSVAVIGIVLYFILPQMRIIDFLCSLFMLLAVGLLSSFLGDKIQPDRNAIYAQTYSIFILSWPCQLVAEIVTERLLNLPFTIVFASMLLVGLCVPFAIIYLIEGFERKFRVGFISKIIGK